MSRLNEGKVLGEGAWQEEVRHNWLGLSMERLLVDS